jgi:branched-chain amino acid transport system ATP-binding protein
MLEVNNVSAFYGKIQSLWDVSLRVREDSLTVLIGSNGAGKSTILKAITGVIKPQSGRIRLMGEDITDLPAHRIASRKIAHVPEARRLFPHMTVLENLEIGAYTARDKKKDTLSSVYTLFPILKERRDQKASTLSGGEQQMLAIARGLMSRPELLVLDEPSLGLAPIMVDKVFDALKELNKQLTILLVEQNAYRALEISDYGYVIENGRIVLEDDSCKLMRNKRVQEAYLGVTC